MHMGHSAHALALATLALLALGACSSATRPDASASVHAQAPATPGQPVEVTTTFLSAYAHRFTRGEFALVRVCVAADGTIASAHIVVSSTDNSFDRSALGWARQAHYHPQLRAGRPVYGCQEVRVEVNAPREHAIGFPPDSALG
jgi:TonB family protein